MRVFLFNTLTVNKMISKFSTFLSDKIDIDTNIFWFKNSNKYIIVNDVINNLILNKINPSDNKLNSETLKVLNKENNKSVITEITSLLSECNEMITPKKIKKSNLDKFKVEYISKIKFNSKIIKFEYGNKKLKNLIEPKFKHLNTKEDEQATFKIFEDDKKINLFREDLFLGSWGVNEMHEFQGKVSMELTSFFHNKKEDNWTCVFHGSTLTKVDKSVMLTGDSGSGKSSLSTILMANSFSLIADDFSPMSDKQIHYNFPSAISIKEGFYKEAEKIYENFKNLSEYFINEIKGNVKYLPFDRNNIMILSSRCNTVINVKFGKNLSNSFNEINKGEALNKILPDCWISNNEKHAKSFIKWVKFSKFYDITYNDNEEVLKIINKII